VSILGHGAYRRALVIRREEPQDMGCTPLRLLILT
jgi:hypothetical protein